jgi:hypothetical protein
MPVKIASLELENVKRVSALSLSPAPNGLTLIGGDNAQGKTSVLDAIAFALGGEKYRPSNLAKVGAVADPYIKLTLSNGLVVERKGKNAALKVTDPAGRKAGQALLDSFVAEFALDLSKFLNAKPADKAKTLLQLLGIGDKLDALQKQEDGLYNQREAEGRIADQKKKFYQEMAWHDGVPEAPLSASDLLAQSQEVMRRNAELANARQNVKALKETAEGLAKTLKTKEGRVAELEGMLTAARAEAKEAELNHLKAKKDAEDAASTPIGADESTAEVEAQIDALEETNAKVRQNLDKEKAKEDAEAARKVYDGLTADIEAVRTERKALLDSAPMPLPGLSVEKGELVFNGKAWDCMSASEQLRAGVAILRALNPECGFVLLDKLEQMDLSTLGEFGGWLESNKLQGISTRVSKGEECAIIIEDGRAVVNKMETPVEDVFATIKEEDKF